ncbi:hypothetical protein DENSPDRAFT_855728, partial [Dentipellis sp. KUC8613]
AQSALEAISTDIGRTGLDVIDSYRALKVHLGALVRFRGATHTPPLSDAIVARVDTLINELRASITALEQAALPLPKLHNDICSLRLAKIRCKPFSQTSANASEHIPGRGQRTPLNTSERQRTPVNMSESVTQAYLCQVHVRWRSLTFAGLECTRTPANASERQRTPANVSESITQAYLYQQPMKDQRTVQSQNSLFDVHNNLDGTDIRMACQYRAAMSP